MFSPQNRSNIDQVGFAIGSMLFNTFINKLEKIVSKNTSLLMI